MTGEESLAFFPYVSDEHKRQRSAGVSGKKKGEKEKEKKRPPAVPMLPDVQRFSSLTTVQYSRELKEKEE